MASHGHHVESVYDWPWLEGFLDVTDLTSGTPTTMLLQVGQNGAVALSTLMRV
jgi:hypothetical protein